jgi:phage-related holin
VTPVVLTWYIITELGSIIENAGKMGAPVPEWLKKSLKQYKDTIDKQHGIDGEDDDGEN